MLSEQLLIDRAGNFTASENHKLMAGWDKPEPNRDFTEFSNLYRVMSTMSKKPLIGELKALVDVKVTGKLVNDTWAVIQHEKPSQGLITYAQEKAIEELFDVDPSLTFSTIHTQNGEERELECMELLADETGLNFVNTGEEQAHIHTSGVGCTPDGIVLDDMDLVLTGAEVKCKSPLYHAKNILINDANQLKKEAFDHFTQIQTAMLVTGAEYWYFANYNPFGKTPELRFKYITIGRDNDFIRILKNRIELAKKIKNEFLAKIKNCTR